LPHAVTLESGSLGLVDVVALTAREAMSSLTPWSVEILVEDVIDEAALARKAATVRFVDEVDGSERGVQLVVARVLHQGKQREGHRYLLSLAPPGWLFAQREGYKVFVDKTTQEIVTAITANSRLTLKWRLSGTYMKRVQCVQYRETEWAFIERILADEGIAYWFDAGDDGPILVLGDDPGSHDGIEGGPVAYRALGGMESVAAFDELEWTVEMASDATHVRDFDVRQPKMPIEGKAGTGGLEVFEFPACVLTNEAATRRAKARLDQLQRDSQRLVGSGDCARLQPGFVVEVEGAMDDEGNGKFIVVSIDHDYRRPTPQDDQPRAYSNRVTMVPAKDRTYRPAIPRSAPRVAELEPAVTTGPAGDEIHVDDLGRVKIRWMWDRSGIGDDRSSAWVRCLQMGVGGSMLLPRVGWEVPVGYMYGIPDQPVVFGRMYNATAVVPYGLPAAAMKTTLQSATSPGGGSTNEIRMDDSAGKQEVFIHASKDQTVMVGGNSQEIVGNSETYDVGLSHALGVKGSHTHDVGAAQKVNVGTEHVVLVKGARTETIGAMENIHVTGNVTVLSDSSYSETVGAMHGLECNQSNTKVQGAFTQMVGGTLNIAGALGTGENVAAARSESVSGARIILAGKYIEAVTGTKSVTAGAASDKAGQKLVTEVKGAVKTEAASLTASASGPLVISASTVTFDVSGSLTAGALELKGGTFKATKGTSLLKGTIKRQGETKIE
jgi:type VI secretion system secreted protein VgrG